MKKLFVLSTCCILMTSAFAADQTAAPDEAKKAEMMQAWKEASTPSGPEHEMLKSLVGKWNVKSTSWETENGKPELTTGTSTFTPILGGRFVEQKFKGKMMGQTYEGQGKMGFNKVSKKFESSWYDNMSTAAMNFEGTYDEGTKTISESGEFDCPIRKTPQKMRSEMKMNDKNTFTFSLFMPDMVTGKEFKSMEQVYKRM